VEYEDFLNPHSGRISHTKPGQKRYKQAIKEGWQRLSKEVIPHIRKDIGSGVDTKEPDYLRNLKTRLQTHPYQLTYKGETTYYRTEAERQRYADALKRYSVTSPIEGAVTWYRTKEAAERYAASLPKWYIEQEGERAYFQTERAARMSQVPDTLGRLSEFTTGFFEDATHEVVSTPTPEITVAPTDGRTITLTLEEAVAQGYITPDEAQRRREAAYQQAYDEAHEKATKAAMGAEVQFDPEKGVFYWYAEQEPDPLLAPPEWSRFRGPKEGTIGHTLSTKFKEILGVEEKAFKTRTDPLLVYTGKQEEKSLELMQEGKPWEGFAAYSRGIASHFAITTFEGLTFFVRPAMWGQSIAGMITLATDKEAFGQLRSVVAADPFKVAMGVAGGVTGGYIFGKGVSKISDIVLGKQTSLTRLEDLDFEVENIQTKWRLKGSQKRIRSKYLIPEEFEDLSFADEVMGVLEGEEVSIAGKLKTTEGFIDDALEAIKRKTKASLKTEGIPEFEAQLLGKTDDITITGKELAPKIEITTPKTKIGILDEVEGLTFLETPEKMTEFGGPYYTEGKILGLEKGIYQFDVKGGFAKIDDVIADIKGILPEKPLPGEKTPWRFTHQQPGFTVPTGKLENILKQDIEITKELTRGLSPVANIVESPISAKSMGIGAAIGITPRVKVVSKAIRMEHEAIQSYQSFAHITTPIQRLKLTQKEVQLQPLKITQEVRPIEIQKIKNILKLDIKTEPIQKEMPLHITKPIVEPAYITEPITTPLLKMVVTPKPILKEIQIPQPILDKILIQLRPTPIPPILRFYRPRKRKRRKAKEEKGFGLLEVRVDPLKMKGVKKRRSGLKEVLRF